LEIDPAARWRAQDLTAQLKSIAPRQRSGKRPMLLFAIAAAVILAAGTWFWRNANGPAITSIAVLPFMNSTPQAETE